MKDDVAGTDEDLPLLDSMRWVDDVPVKPSAQSTVFLDGTQSGSGGVVDSTADDGAGADAAPAHAAAPQDTLPPERDHRYRPVEVDGALGSPGARSAYPLLGEGGLGRVFAVYDPYLGRLVALKKMRPGRRVEEHRALTARFLREARVTSRLEHPSIVPVHELGRDDQGNLFYTMKQVRGRTLTEAIAGCTSLKERLGLLNHVVDLCQAIAYAHSHAIIHRDIKPDNVMIGEFGETVVLDWGLARVLGEAEPDGAEATFCTGLSSGMTQHGAVLGTPAYMSPEQARGEVALLDERSDTWSLGAVLFELLTGRRAFDGDDVAELLDAVGNGQAPRTEDLCPELPAELRAIVDRTLTRDRSLRYPSAGELSADLLAFQAGALVSAHHYTSWELLCRFVGHHRGTLMTGLVGLAILAALGSWSLQRIIAARNDAIAANLQAESQHEVALDHLAESLVQQARTSWEAGSVAETWLLAGRALELRDTPEARGLVMGAMTRWTPKIVGESALPAACRRFIPVAGGDVLACAGPDAVVTWDGSGATTVTPSAGAWATAVSADAQVVAVSQETDAGPRVLLFDAGHDRPRSRLAVPGTMPPLNLAFSPDAKRLYGVVGLWDSGEITVSWDVASGAVIATRSGDLARGVDVSPDGRMVALAGQRSLSLVDADTLQTLQIVSTGSAGAAAARFSPDGERMAAATINGDLLVWRSRGGEVARISGEGGSGVVTWAPDGETLFDRRESGIVRLLDAATGTVWFRSSMVVLGGSAVQPTPDWSQLVVLPADGDRARVWDLSGWQTSGSVLGQVGAGKTVDWLDADRLLVWGGGRSGSDMSIWDEGQHTVRPLSTRSFNRPSLSSDRLRVLVRDDDAVRIVDVESGRLRLEIPAQTVQAPRWSSTNDAVVAHTSSGHLGVWDAGDGHELADLVLPQPAASDFAPTQGGQIAAFGADGESVDWLEVTTGRVIGTTDIEGPGLTMAATRSGRFLAIGFGNGDVGIVDSSEHKLLSRWQAHPRFTRRVAVSEDGSLIATSAVAHSVRLWDVRDQRLIAEFVGHHNRIIDLVFAPGGDQLVTSDADGVLLRWDLLAARRRPGELAALARARFGLEVTGAHVEPLSLDPVELVFPSTD